MLKRLVPALALALAAAPGLAAGPGPIPTEIRLAMAPTPPRAAGPAVGTLDFAQDLRGDPTLDLGPPRPAEEAAMLSAIGLGALWLLIAGGLAARALAR